MSVKMRIEVEKKIVGQFVKDALAAGFVLAVSLERGYDIGEMLIASDDYDKIMEAAFAGDDCHIFVQEKNDLPVEDGKIVSSAWVYCVFGNDGWDVISDYSVSLDDEDDSTYGLLKGADEISKQYA